MSYNDEFDEYEEETWGEDEANDESTVSCPECGAEVFDGADACPECGYWFTEADRSAAWRRGSASGRVLRIGWWMLAAAALAMAATWLF